MKHVWRMTRAALAAAGLVLIAGTPAGMAAAGVSTPLLLAGGTAAAAGVVVIGGIGQDRYRRQRARREQQTLRVHHGSSPALADWKPPKVREITDPVLLGTHRAAPAEAAAGDSAGSADAPPYIPRDQDGELRELLAAGGFVLLVGDSTAGKTRMAFEALHATLPDHSLIAPDGVDAIADAVRQAADERRCVLWLDDLERFLGPGGITAADLARLHSGSGHHRVIVATMRAVEQARLTADVRDDDRAWQGLRDVREVLDQARQIRVARLFTTSELERAKSRDWDPRIGDAVEHANTHGVAEWIAAGPLLLRDWERARSSATETLARGAALVTAAVDLRRAGYVSAIPRDLLDEIHGEYLHDPEPARAPRELGEAWAWATTRRAGSTRLLTPAGDNRVGVFDYLTDTAQRRAGPLDRVLEPVVRTALASASASDANSIARTAYNQGRWQLAADAWRIACDLLAAEPGIGEHHPDTLACRSNLALVLHDLGRLEEADAEDRAVVAARQLVLGDDHPDTLASRGNLALVLRDMGRLTEAKAEIRDVVAARRRLLGPDHPDSLASRSNLALVLHDLGRLNEAKTEIRAVLAIRKRVLGPDHPSTLASRGNLALVLRRQGRLEQAEAEISGVPAIALRVLGPDHPSTLTSRNNLAAVLRELGRLNEAMAEIRAVLAARQQVLGPDHPDSLASRNNLARVLRDLGWLDEAEAEIRAVLAIRLRVLGPDHRSTLGSRNNLAGLLHERGRLEEAEAQIREVLTTMQRVLGPGHPDTVASRNNLALVLHNLGWPDEAEVEIPAVLPADPVERAPDDLGALADGSRSAADEVDDDAEAELLVHER